MAGYYGYNPYANQVDEYSGQGSYPEQRHGEFSQTPHPEQQYGYTTSQPYQGETTSYSSYEELDPRGCDAGEDRTDQKDAQSSSQGTSKNKSTTGKYLQCLYQECKYKTERQFDLERHMNKHYPPGPDQLLDCPGRGCGRVGEHGFKRIDHLTEHLKKVHGKKTR